MAVRWSCGSRGGSAARTVVGLSLGMPRPFPWGPGCRRRWASAGVVSCGLSPQIVDCLGSCIVWVPPKRLVSVVADSLSEVGFL